MPKISSLSKLPELTASLKTLMGTASIPGMSLAVVSEKRIWAGELGVANIETKESVTNKTVFEAASLSKTIFAYLVKKMNFPLDKPFSEILSSEELQSVLKARSLDHLPEAKNFTAKMVLSHQTGLPNFGKAPEGPLETDKFKYSGTGYRYLQTVLKKKTGKTLNELAKQYVFEPLNMTHSTFGWSEKLATGHDELNHPIKPHEEDSEEDSEEHAKENAAASLHTTASDYALFLQAVISDPTFFKQPVNVPDSQLTWGLGWGLQEENNIAFHWGDNGIFKAFVAIKLDTKTAIVYFANSENGLAIAQDVVTPIVGDVQSIFDWLHSAYRYEQHDSPNFEANLKGKAAEISGNYEEAKTHYSTLPDDEAMKRRIQNLDDLIKAKATPLNIDAETLQKYVGQYDGPKITMESDGYLHLTYGKTFRLIPLSETKFAAEHDSGIQFEFKRDNDGNGIEIIAHLASGGTMPSSRDPAELTNTAS